MNLLQTERKNKMEAIAEIRTYMYGKDLTTQNHLNLMSGETGYAIQNEEKQRHTRGLGLIRDLTEKYITEDIHSNIKSIKSTEKIEAMEITYPANALMI